MLNINAINEKIDPNSIIQDSDFRFVSDHEKNIWNNKAEITLCSIENHGLMSIDDKIKLSSIDKNANYYIHPQTHPATIINETDNRLFMTKYEKEKLEYLENYTHPEYHNAEIILENSNKRFVSDYEKVNWNNKEDKNHKHNLSDIIDYIDDFNKPISFHTQIELNNKINKSEFELLKSDIYEYIQNEISSIEIPKSQPSIINNVTGTSWGKITGSLSNQWDLNCELNKKVDIDLFNLEIKNLKQLSIINKQNLNLDKVNNTSDLDKPISNLCKIELNKKLDIFTFNKHITDSSHITMEERMRWNSMYTSKQNSFTHINEINSLNIENYNGKIKPIYDNNEIRIYSEEENIPKNNICVKKSDISDNSNSLKGVDGKQIINTINELVKEVLGLKSIMCDFVKQKNPNSDINEYSSILDIQEALNRL